ncbi:MAG: UDP-N-acetylenolpyruvoylglucosamine reductase [Woeseia sp.]|nr:UDP-N-acetylenolpyruvoylglucosamine reductase [Woeseia sp.]|tara:strand:- start:184 stop:1083 length:900 start_codon:yes stop_codon:yes gene_type:complete
MSALPNVPHANGEFLKNEPMSRHTSWRIGGTADMLFRPHSVEDLAQFLYNLEADIPIFWLGLGSNLLVRDGGLPGVVIATARIFTSFEYLGEQVVRVGSSIPCTQLSRQCVRLGLGPSEFFAGIPGTLGGALAMNAGAHGSETWELVRLVRTIDRRGELRERVPDDYQIGYRSVSGPIDEWFVGAELEFDSNIAASMDRYKEMLSRRKETQPLGLPSCGSVFRNPPNDYAARLIEACGLKGCRIGNAEVSDKHANFIINRGNATALDVENLILHIHQTVADATGIELVPEVLIIGREAA